MQLKGIFAVRISRLHCITVVVFNQQHILPPKSDILSFPPSLLSPHQCCGFKLRDSYWLKDTHIIYSLHEHMLDLYLRFHEWVFELSGF